MIRYYLYSGNNQKINVNAVESKPVYQPELQTYLFYAYNDLRKFDHTINNKMIKKKLFIKALNSFNNFYLNLYIIMLEDQLMNFILYKTAKSFYFLKKFGYYYKKNTMSICNNDFKLPQIGIKSRFIYIKLVYEYSKNIKYEKDITNFLLAKLNRRIKIIRELSPESYNNDFNFYYEIINMLLNCKFISEENKLLLLKLKNMIEIKNKTFVNSTNMLHL